MHRKVLIVFALCISARLFDQAAATADDHCDETCEQIKFHKVKVRRQGITDCTGRGCFSAE